MNNIPDFTFEKKENGDIILAGVNKGLFQRPHTSKMKEVLDDYFQHGKPIPLEKINDIFSEMVRAREYLNVIITKHRKADESFEDTVVRLCNEQHKELIDLVLMLESYQTFYEMIFQNKKDSVAV